ncbi:hypothetical protein AHAS_Ahas07G0097200 [Arachis hypogaea]
MELSLQTLLQISLTLQRVPIVNLDSEQLLQTQGSSTPSVNAASNTSPAKEQQQQSKEPPVVHYKFGFRRPLEQQEQPCEEPTVQQSEQEAPINV